MARFGALAVALQSILIAAFPKCFGNSRSEGATDLKELPEIKLFRPTATEQAFEHAGNDIFGRPVGHRNKLGGQPDWLQAGYEAPACSQCRKAMTFYGQLDSIDEHANIADCGMIYVFLCFDCFQADAIAMC
jgi:hypothetical protein